MKTIFNPYPEIGKQLINGMEFIIKNIEKTDNVDNLVDIVSKYVSSLYYPKNENTEKLIEIKSVAYNVINTYLNSTFESSVSYNSNQNLFISLMLRCLNSIPVYGVGSYLKDVEESIVSSGISIVEQTPLLIASMNGRSINSYWENTISSTSKGKWNNFINSNPAINNASIPFWTEACIQGSLIGANASHRGLISTTIEIVTVEIVSALIGALSIGAGVVLFSWIPKVNLSFGGCSDDFEGMRRENTGAGSYTESGISVSYTADFIKGNRARYYFN